MLQSTDDCCNTDCNLYSFELYEFLLNNIAVMNFEQKLFRSLEKMTAFFLYWFVGVEAAVLVVMIFCWNLQYLLRFVPSL